jgi:hypothetical protein
MNNHVRIFLPLTLLLSTMAYTMDKDEQNIFEVPVEKQNENPEHLVIAVQSLVLPPPPSSSRSINQPEKRTDTLQASSTIEAKSQGLGAFKWVSDNIVFGEDKNVLSELKDGTFDKSITANTRRLERTVEKYSKQQTPASLETLHTLMSLCAQNNIAIDSTTVLDVERKYVCDCRKAEEAQLTDKVKATLKSSLETRTAILNKLREQFSQAMDALKANNAGNEQAIMEIFKKHQPIILKAVQAERYADKVNDHLKPYVDGTKVHDSYDVPFLEVHLKLKPLMQSYNDSSDLISNNLGTNKELLDVVDKKTIEKQQKTASTSNI